MKSTLITVSIFTALSCVSALAEDKRAADAHQHGHGALNVALEGDTLSIELETPGADILGFEHTAETEGDKATVRKARETLGNPVALFGLPDAAGCSVADADIEIGADGEHHEDDDHDHEHDDDHKHGDEHAHEEDTHSEVHAQYTLTCTAPSNVTALDLSGFFAAFPNAKELDAAVLTDAGQASGEITPAATVLTF